MIEHFVLDSSAKNSLSLGNTLYSSQKNLPIYKKQSFTFLTNENIINRFLPSTKETFDDYDWNQSKIKK